MNNPIEIPPHLVHESATHLFWNMAAQDGFDATVEAVADSEGECLVRGQSVDKVMLQVGIRSLNSLAKRELCRAVAAEAVKFVRAGKNMNGIIYGDDAENGRSPSATHVETRHLWGNPRQVIRYGASVEKMGSLCLRHPLPAVVFSKDAPFGSVIEVGNTAIALGFHCTMFLGEISAQQISDDLFALMGVFFIPASDRSRGDMWGKVIQNSVRVIDRIEFQMAEGDFSVDVLW
jgi:hypothetical protein